MSEDIEQEGDDAQPRVIGGRQVAGGVIGLLIPVFIYANNRFDALSDHIYANSKDIHENTKLGLAVQQQTIRTSEEMRRMWDRVELLTASSIRAEEKLRHIGAEIEKVEVSLEHEEEKEEETRQQGKPK